jgi:ligand-binding sensor domain-containing protein/signal transduction histidine kinase
MPKTFSHAPVRAAFLALFLSHGASLAQTRELRFERVSVEQGLSNFTVTSIVQDRQGFLWLSTADGLNKYDGYDFKVYKHDPADSTSLPWQDLSCLLVDRAGTLWLGAGPSNRGLYRYAPEIDGFLPFSSKAPLADSLARQVMGLIYEDRRGDFWLSTSAGLFRYQHATDALQDFPPNPQDSTALNGKGINAIAEDRAGALWIGSAGGGLFRWEAETARFKHYRIASRSGNDAAPRKILEDRRGMMWVATTEGLYRFNRATGAFELAPAPRGKVFEHIVTLFEDSHGRLWVGTFGAGLWRYDAAADRFDQSLHDPSDPNSLSANRIEFIFEDRSGILWFATYRNGLNRYNRKQEAFARYPFADAIYAVLEDRRGEVWLGTSASGLLRFARDGNLLRHYRPRAGDSHSLSNDNVMALRSDPVAPDDLWIGTGTGVNRYDARRDRFVRYAFDENDANIRDEANHAKTIFLDAAGEILIGTKGRGVFRFNRAASRLQAESPRLADQSAWSIAQEPGGALWIGNFGGGLFRFERDTESLTRFHRNAPAPSRLSSDNLYALYIDSSGSIWMGTTSGLNRLDPKTGRVYFWQARDGLPDNFVKGILPDAHGNLWLSTDNGLSRFNLATQKFKNYAVKEGLLNNTFLSGAYFKTDDGRMLFGCEGGAIAFHPDSLRDNTQPPQVAFTAFKIFDKAVSVPNAAEPSLRLSYQQNFFSFEFVALDFNNPIKHQYAYRLEGFDRDWIQAGGRRYASYTNVDPGKYVFRVKGSNSDGAWNEEGASMRIVIAPPFWRTWWFRALAVLVIGATVFGLYRYRVNRLLERTRLAAHLQSARETERTHLAREIHDELGQYLTGLKMDVAFMENMIAEHDGENGRAALLNKVHGMSSLLDTTVKTVRKISTELRPAILDSMGLLAAIEWLAQEFQNHSGIACECYLTANEVNLERERATAVFRIVQESLTNVMRHAKATRVTITFEKEASHYLLEVKDNGRGVQPSDLRKRTSFGVLGMQERAHVFRGSLTLAGEPGKGTTVRVKIPL